MNAKHLLCVLTLPAALACGTQEQQPAPAIPTPGVEAAPRAETTTEIRGWWEVGDAAGPFEARFSGDRVLQIDQELMMGDYGTSRARFEFEDGALVRYSSESRQRMIDPEKPADLVPVLLELEFDSAGNVSLGEKTVDGVPVDLDPLDADRVRGQAGALVAEARVFARVAAGAGDPVRFLCDDDEIVEISIFGAEALLDLGPFDGRFVLAQDPVAPDRYGNGRISLRTDGAEASVERDGEHLFRVCRREDLADDS